MCLLTEAQREVRAERVRQKRVAAKLAVKAAEMWAIYHAAFPGSAPDLTMEIHDDTVSFDAPMLWLQEVPLPTIPPTTRKGN